MDNLRNREEAAALHVTPFVPDRLPGDSLKMPKLGHASLFDPETYILKYDRIAEVSSLLDRGKASWYGPNFHGKLTASGEPYDMHAFTAAHPTLPFDTLVWVENTDNGRMTLVRVNDRGPYAGNRVIDVSREAAKELRLMSSGVANVNLYLAEREGEEQSSKHTTGHIYTIQLGLFKTGSKALSFAREIEGARVEVIHQQEEVYYGVFYGLFASRREAFRKQRRLEEQSDFDGFVKQRTAG
ncbi:SPOR domain-containing protein [Fodinibius sediminis]|uniref:SPOR domain-containing protein n=1 Tax=Fodinibius sediminis TaxID=1214077 RepID=UPI00115A0A39|nr:SPOR domain-containing protein [Fodinibius sediminis]